MRYESNVVGFFVFFGDLALRLADGLLHLSFDLLRRALYLAGDDA